MKIFVRPNSEGNRPRSAGYSLVELVGVLSLVAIAAGVLTPTAIVLVDRAVKEAEEQALEEYSVGFVDYVESFRALPGESDWAAAVGGRIEEPIHDVLTNRVGNARAFLVDPNFWADEELSFPVEQGVDGWSKPESPRFMIISSVGAELPVGDFDFDELWVTPEGGVISTNAPWNTWDGSWEDIRIERINLKEKFHRVVLNNSENEDSAGYRVDGLGDESGDALPVTGPRVDFYLLEGTVLELTSAGASMATEILTESESFFYSIEGWSDRLVEEAGENSWVDDFCDDMAHWVQFHGYDASDISVNATVDALEIRAGYCEVLAEDLLMAGWADEGDEAAADGEEHNEEAASSAEEEDGDDGDDGSSDVEDDDEDASPGAGGETNEDESADESDNNSGGKSNNGHGNNEDGVDVSNPGQGHGGPNGEEDPSGDIDDEMNHGNGGSSGSSNQDSGSEGTANANVSAEFSSNKKSVSVSSTEELENVVLRFQDDAHQKFEGLSGTSGLFSGSGSNRNKKIIGVWIKAGANESGAGPEYGEYVDNPRL